MEAVHDTKRLAELQALPLERKIQISQARIIEWYQHYNGNVVVSFSGGKDSTVLLHMVRKLYPDVRAVFSNTGLEFPEIQRFAKSFDNVDIVTPSMRFDEVITTYGYPIIGKEVAEAIYYARRIRTPDEHTELSEWRERERTCPRKREELNGSRYRVAMLGKLTTDERANRTIRAGVVDKQGSETFWKRTELTGKYQNERDINGITGKTKSQFNKEKWLPLAREAPFLVSHKCCAKMKKSPIHKYQTAHKYQPILATLAEESRVRKQGWIRHGCNAFDSASPKSQPMSFWTEQDVLAYIVKYNLPIASVYGDIVSIGADGNEYPAIDISGKVQCNLKCTGCQRTGCIFCAFGAHLEKGETRFQRLAKTHPRQYEYCIGGGEWIDNPFYDPAAPVWDGEWKNWNPKKIWSRNGKGLGLGKVFDICNEMYGKDFIRYE